MSKHKNSTTRSLTTIINWFDSYAETGDTASLNQHDTLSKTSSSLNWLRIIPFLILHLACFAVIWVGWSPVAVIVSIGFYMLRMVGITAFYHRYFAHKAFKAGRFTQFIFALIGSAATQRGPLWWASHHRHHHHYSDTDKDIHSPKKGFFWSHVGWFLSDKNFKTRLDLIPDFAKFKELVSLGTSGLQMLIWGYVISTVVLLHATLSINSFAHKIGSRRFKTSDTSRNNFILAIITFGEGWHNNHHQFPNSARQGIKWWEIDLSFYLIKIMEKIGLVWNVKPGPNKVQITRALETN